MTDKEMLEKLKEVKEMFEGSFIANKDMQQEMLRIASDIVMIIHENLLLK